MRKAAAIAFAAVALAGALLVVVLGATEDRTLAFTLGAPATAPVITLRPQQTACQLPVPVEAAFDEVELQPGTFGARGQPLKVSVLGPDGTGSPLASGRLAGGYPDVARQTVAVGSVPEGGRVAVCVTNEGTRRVALYGAVDAANGASSAELDGEPTAFDLDLVFRTEQPRSTLSLVPDMLQRMALFRGGSIGAWTYWLLLAAVLGGAPLLLWRALRSALAEAGDDAGAARDGDQRETTRR